MQAGERVLSEPPSTLSEACTALAELETSAHDLVILDTVLPALSGWEILRRIRCSSGVPVMLLTNRSSNVDKARGLDLGADDYLTKPFGFLEFEARVRAASQGADRESASGGFGGELHAGGGGMSSLPFSLDKVFDLEK